ncbi:DUF1573 domain-containing protein [Panacibacter sp. DH6]|uniref:DUF1573 domain-containing protein n=1 Tax=Panacibacter microcysteis TaxID=2793269 RepID=A0A931GZY5_9BACT|nr:DUF1573 domain-containing protein [Panacibacter microcysteis]MBG9378454.1 DUF1573 domain-containing protein [Panacibacter microcysteis]
MRKLLAALAFVIAIPVLAQTNAPVSFKETKHSFGKIAQGKPVTTEFSFTNVSDKPVVIESAVAGCGCTKPEYPETPIMKGKSATIKVTYNAASVGNFTKTVTVKLAGTAEPIVLTIDGEVLKP